MEMAIVRYVLAALKPGVDREAYERYEREVDYVVAGKLKSIVNYRTHRLTDVVGQLGGGPWHYLERIEVTDRAAYEAEIATLGKELIDELYEKYLDRSKTRSIWTVLIDP
jgi:REDY-like protein HapK